MSLFSPVLTASSSGNQMCNQYCNMFEQTWKMRNMTTVLYSGCQQRKDYLDNRWTKTVEKAFLNNITRTLSLWSGVHLKTATWDTKT
ncbi:hypothetical protein AG0111_0g3231 [Alternaria gaisen]|uniref:Uncharacterized protein n=1 Tax=Alternaria gaisen TaxID=167740 RepID=A0ACB6FVM6_9PLEO|nr:hypothetical protein AG0111_0g3231 [Alternaria gaisen]